MCTEKNQGTTGKDIITMSSQSICISDFQPKYFSTKQKFSLGTGTNPQMLRLDNLYFCKNNQTHLHSYSRVEHSTIVHTYYLSTGGKKFVNFLTL